MENNVFSILWGKALVTEIKNDCANSFGDLGDDKPKSTVMNFPNKFYVKAH